MTGYVSAGLLEDTEPAGADTLFGCVGYVRC